jgi:hypothetical protein
MPHQRKPASNDLLRQSPMTYSFERQQLTMC